ncbi:hypothetical protein FRC17_008415 [Serendipita sp. 399]|nr:hypothetical protein FRC17_008415 [Serendipita sp. 399]
MPILPHAMRIESPARSRCACHTKCPRDPITKAQLESLAATTDGSDSLESVVREPLNARVILLPRRSQSQDAILDALQYAQPVQALECNSGFLRESQVPKLQGLFGELTHLSISSLFSKHMTMAPCLPRLHYLQLRLTLTRAQLDGNYVPLSEWKFSQLTSLVLEGFIIDARHEEVLQFGLNHSTLLKHLILLYRIEHDEFEFEEAPSIDISYLCQFRQLEVLGVEVRALEGWETVRNPSHPLRLSLLLDVCIDIYRMNRDEMMCIAGQCVQLCRPPGSLFDKVILSQSWDQIDRHRDALFGREKASRRRASPASKLFKELERWGIRVFDRDGVGFQDGDGRKRLKML